MIGKLVKVCRRDISKKLLKGFMMASWQRTIPEEQEKGLKAVDQLAAERAEKLEAATGYVHQDD